MTLYFAEWHDVESCLIDAESDDAAQSIATEIDESRRPPVRLRRLPPNVLAFSVRVVSVGMSADEVIELLPFPHAGEFLSHLIDTELPECPS
jgi:hypothetical protein